MKKAGDKMPSAARIRKNQKEKKKRQRRRRILIGVFIGILVLFVGVYAYLSSLLGQADQVDIDESDLGLVEDPGKVDINLSNKNIVNIALFGIDTRNGDYSNSLSDTILIATLDFDHKKLKLTSVMRDTFASIPDKDYKKINSAFAYGGPTLAIKTLNTNYDMNITDFATVNFEAMEKIVDAVGGVEIDIKPYELNEINVAINHQNKNIGTNTQKLESSGRQVLDGGQALAYSRIRKVGNADFERTERQRTVLEQVLNKVLKDRSITKAMRFADSLLPYVQTSMSRSEILSIGTKVMTSGTTNLVNTRIPLDDHVKNATINGGAVLLPTSLIDNVAYLHNFIYENDEFEPSDRLQDINDTMAQY
ncbi:LCP family protein [Alkalibacter rhizosphaerae]|uniref:LCP family protein n=1 Tax=Alkalibacter rhizosphaerae TaxID=2815577 RepID=A0A975AI44_9FIRM|nr:LCP family protein [Alkalibacter rhizosphaerae]QSX09289.1 LCP family protein [Alkalibacter rhizosphaerae]